MNMDLSIIKADVSELIVPSSTIFPSKSPLLTVILASYEEITPDWAVLAMNLSFSLTYSASSTYTAAPSSELQLVKSTLLVLRLP